MNLRSTSGVFALALVLAACGSGADLDDDVADTSGEPQEPDTAAPAEDEADDEEPEADDVSATVLQVVATVAPVTDLVQAVGGDRIEATSLVPSGADAHTYEPRPQDVVVLSEADAYIGIGLDLNDGAIRLAEENLPETSPLFLLGDDVLGDDELVFDHSHDDEGGHAHDDGEGEAHSHDDEDGGHTHDDEGDGHTHDDEGDGHSHDDEGEGAGPNPHVWTSLGNARALVDGIATILSDLDPDGSDDYEANAATYGEQLDELDQLVADAADTIPEQNRTLVTYHDAWTYFARDYGLEFATAVQPADFSDPSAGEVRDVVELIRELEVSVVFGSEVFPTPVLETIADETGADYRGDLSDDVLPGDPGTPEHTYLELMRRNAVTIVGGLGGDTTELDRFAVAS